MQIIFNLANVLEAKQKIDVDKRKTNVYVKSGIQVLQVFFPTCPIGKNSICKTDHNYFDRCENKNELSTF